MEGLVRVLVWISVIFAAACALLYFTVFDVFTVPTDDPAMLASTAPNVAGGDQLLTLRHGEVHVGNLVRCTDPQEPRRFVIGRLEGIGGETLEITNERVALDGRSLTIARGCGRTETVTKGGTNEQLTFVCSVEDLSSEHEVLFYPDSSEGTTAKTKISSGKGFLVSDNRYWHLDSRDYGEVPLESCQHIVFRLWSAAGWFDAHHRLNLLW
jgi:signal peptidase I